VTWVPPYAPAAETWHRTAVESMLWREVPTIAWVGPEVSDSHIPASLHRRKRRYAVIHLPYMSGRSRQGAPMRMRHRMPFAIFGLSCAGRFLRPRSAGNKPISRDHSALLRSPRLKTAPPNLQP
jgi:hypothetical protein